MEVEKYYDENAPLYDGEYTSPFFQLYKALTWENIRQFLPPKDAVILDAGGGTGEWAIRLTELGYHVVLTDVSWGMLRQARLKIEEKNIQTIEIKRVNITDLSCFSDNTFDMVLAQGDPLSYCGDAEKAVTEMYRVSKPGCCSIASVDSSYYQVLKILAVNQLDTLDEFLKTGLASFQGKFTIRCFTPQSLRSLFEGAGFEVVRMLAKPVFLSVLPREKATDLLKDSQRFQKVLQLELQHCDDPNLIGFGSHLEIVGKKPF